MPRKERRTPKEGPRAEWFSYVMRKVRDRAGGGPALAERMAPFYGRAISRSAISDWVNRISYPDGDAFISALLAVGIDIPRFVEASLSRPDGDAPRWPWPDPDKSLP